MQSIPAHQPCNPLDLSEIRIRVARYLSRKDRVSCMLVSQDWFQDFVGPVWHTVNFFTDQISFFYVPTDTLNKYGGLITRVTNIRERIHLCAIQHSKVNRIKWMKVHLLMDPMFQNMLSEILVRSSSELESLDIGIDERQFPTLVHQREETFAMVYFSNIFATGPASPAAEHGILTSQGNQLRTLKLRRVNITREDFSSMLRFSPNLDELFLECVIVLGHEYPIPLYTGSRLSRLNASLAQVWTYDVKDRSAPCLLLHFPLLRKWEIPSLVNPPSRSIILKRLDFSSWCPLLKIVVFGGMNKADTMSALLLYSLKALESCTFTAKYFNFETTCGLITHQDTLTSIISRDGIQDYESMRWVYLVLKQFRCLQVLHLDTIRLNMNIVEKNEWACQDLRDLRVRFKGLEAPNDINKCLKELCLARRSPIARSLVRFSGADQTVPTRVVRHLIQFLQLKTVWLGTKVYYIPSSTA
ncbi:hypothetical protein BGZ95_005246 [Linnemannia exigua]|uniref:F-box domain-containing protein n=1 Tax=Linnemannia exigua TaxID=604196 RepID=A0AAD4H8S4_9FUNG|nr:hypothetical protein BGZ95_005246 [Linnemannia exigua]